MGATSFLGTLGSWLYDDLRRMVSGSSLQPRPHERAPFAPYPNRYYCKLSVLGLAGLRDGFGVATTWLWLVGSCAWRPGTMQSHFSSYAM